MQVCSNAGIFYTGAGSGACCVCPQMMVPMPLADHVARNADGASYTIWSVNSTTPISTDIQNEGRWHILSCCAKQGWKLGSLAGIGILCNPAVYLQGRALPAKYRLAVLLVLHAVLHVLYSRCRTNGTTISFAMNWKPGDSLLQSRLSCM